MLLQEMSEHDLYRLYDALDSLKSSNNEQLFVDIMHQHKDVVIDALQFAIIETIRR